MSRQVITTLSFAAIALLSAVLPIAYVTQLGYIGLNAIVCVGLVLLAGVAGLASFGQAAFVGLGAYTTAYLTTTLELSPWITLPLSLGLTACVGWLLGMLTLRMSGHYLVLATLAWGLSLFHLFGKVPALGGFNGMSNLPAISLFGLSLGGQRAFAAFVWVILGLIMLGCSNLLQSRVGRAMRSLRASTMAESMGVDTARLKIQIFVIAAVLAALAGWLQAHYLRVVAPGSYNVNASLDYLFMTVLGGSSYLVGALVGPLIFEALRAGLRDYIPLLTGVSGNYELVVFALIIIILLQRASGGVLGLVLPWFPIQPTAIVPLNSAPFTKRAIKPIAGELLLSVRGLTKRFGGLMAVNDVSFDVRAGQIVGLIGPNGAGKSTLFNLVMGTLGPSGGTVLLQGKEIQNIPARHIAEVRISRTFQHVQLRPTMSALENVALGAHLRGRSGVLASILHLDRTEESHILTEARLQLKRVGLAQFADKPAGSLALGQQRLLEIARALAADPILLLLDEPAAGLRHMEKEALGRLLKELRAQGIAILIVEHDMSFVMDIADRVVVIEFGNKIAEGSPAAIQSDPKVIEAYLGPSD